MSRYLAALSSGLLFSIGLAIAAMTRTSKIVAFLDITGKWDPSLMLVMVGAIAVYASAYWWSRRRQKPIASDTFARASGARIDGRLVLGAAIFGVGWGLSGFCPGPAITALGAGVTQSLLFVPAMLAGLWLTRRMLALPPSSSAVTTTPADSTRAH